MHGLFISTHTENKQKPSTSRSSFGKRRNRKKTRQKLRKGKMLETVCTGYHAFLLLTENSGKRKTGV